MAPMTSPDELTPTVPAASTRPSEVRPSQAWVVFGAVLALVGIVGGVALVTVGFLADRGPQELGRAEFPGQVQFSSEDRVGRVGVYLERSTLSDVVGYAGLPAPGGHPGRR